MAIILGRKGGSGGGSAAPSGPAGGDLSGTYPNPTLAADAATPIDGWVDDSAATWTRTANTTFTVADDRTAVFTTGSRLKVTDTTTKYFVVVSSVHAAGTTTVTITGGDDFVLAANPTARFYSYAANPQGWPGWFSYTPVVTGYSGSPTVVGRFSVVARECHCYVFSNGTSNATTLTFTVPIAVSAVLENAVVSPIAQVINNGAEAAAGRALAPAAGSAIFTATLTAGGAWTAANGKRIQGIITYSI